MKKIHSFEQLINAVKIELEWEVFDIPYVNENNEIENDLYKGFLVDESKMVVVSAEPKSNYYLDYEKYDVEGIIDINYMLDENGKKRLFDANSIKNIPFEVLDGGCYGYAYDILFNMSKYYSITNAISVYEDYEHDSLCKIELNNFYEELKCFEEKMDDLLYEHRIYK